MNLFKIELKRGFIGRGFIVAVLISIILAVGQFAFMSLKTMINYGNFPMKDVMSYFTIYNRWLLGTGSNFWPFIYLMMIPLLTTVPYGLSYYEDLQSGYINNILIRKSKRAYYFTKLGVNFILSGIIAIISPVINFLLTMTVFPLVKPMAETFTFEVSVKSNEFIYSLFYNHPILYLLFYMVIIFIVMGLLSNLAIALTGIVKNRFVLVLMPFLIYQLVTIAIQIFKPGIYSLSVIINPVVGLVNIRDFMLYATVLSVAGILPFIKKIRQGGEY